MSGDPHKLRFLLSNSRVTKGGKVSVFGPMVEPLGGPIDLRFEINQEGMFPLFVATLLGQ